MGELFQYRIPALPQYNLPEHRERLAQQYAQVWRRSNGYLPDSHALEVRIKYDPQEKMLVITGYD